MPRGGSPLEMMSRYSDHRFEGEEFSSSPSSSPQGRRYVLQNFNMRKQQRERSYRRPLPRDMDVFDEYHDIRNAPPSETSRSSQLSSRSNHVGVSNKVMPTDVPKSVSPRKTPRDPPRFVKQRPDVFASNPKSVTKADSESSPEKQAANAKKDNAKGTKPAPKQPPKGGNTAASVKEKGLTPRDEYMVTKLYGHQIIQLKPSEIRYTHDEITAHFTDGRSLLATFKALLYGKIEIRQGGDGVPLIEVMQVDEKGKKLWFVVNGNRRLFVFRRLEKCGAIETMQVVARRYDSIEMDKHFSTRNLGQTIAVTNDFTIREKVLKEVKAWREWKAKQPKDKSKPKPKQKQTQKPKQQSENEGSCCCCIS